MLEYYSEENRGLSPTEAVLDSGSVAGTVAPVTNMSMCDAYEHLLKEQETELNAPSYLHSRQEARPDRHLRRAADRVEWFLRDERGRDYDDIFEPVAAI
nr:MAG: hypothetical protein J07AB56_08880 [Candidatus Nanosalinarum sp. J07AB56]